MLICILTLLLVYGSESQLTSHDHDESQEPSHPMMINVSDLAEKDPLDASTCPLINMKDYLMVLAEIAVMNQPKYCLIVIGPKDAGKSKGIQVMIPAWEKVGHIVLDIDLKGKPYQVKAKEVLGFYARRVYQLIDGKEFICVRKYVIDHCTMVHVVDSSVELLKVFVQSVLLVLTALGMGVTSVAHFVDAVRDFLKAKWKWLAVMLALLVLTVYILQLSSNPVKELLRPLNESIASGNWKTLYCTLNAISNCIPERRPILIVREFGNFHEDSLESLLRALELEPMKEERLSFPIILETSDFL